MELRVIEKVIAPQFRMISSFYPQQQPFFYPSQVVYQAPVVPMPRFQPRLEPAELSISLPSFSYKTQKEALVPFDPRTCEENHFDNITQAMEFLRQHCMHNHGIFNKQLARAYMPFCQIYNAVQGLYVSGATYPRREFDAAFRYVTR